MQRRSAINTKRRVEFGKAVLLGFEFKQVPRGRHTRWKFSVPEHVDRQRAVRLNTIPDYGAFAPDKSGNSQGWVTGFFNYRHEAVTSALTQAGLVEGGEVLPWR